MHSRNLSIFFFFETNQKPPPQPSPNEFKVSRQIYMCNQKHTPPNELIKVRFLRLGRKKVISCEFPNPGVDGMPLTGSRRGLVGARVS